LKLLLDTHVWIWSQNDPARLGPQAQRLLTAAAHENHICTVSTLELARLVAGGVVDLSMTLQDWVERAVHALDARTVEISHAITIEAYALPGSFHKDPADRLLVAAARCHALTLLTADERILGYSHVRSRDARR
jgi:PIN domain nuclease of toxin-antitoxin system